MPEGPGPAEDGFREVESFEGAVDVVVHHEPVRIPAGALPSAPSKPSGSSFALTFVTGTAAAPWIAAALISRDAMAVCLAIGWCFAFAVSLADDWRLRVRHS